MDATAILRGTSELRSADDKLCANVIERMRYLVKAKVKPGQDKPLLQAIESGTLGRGAVAGDEYLDDMEKARVDEDGVCTCVEVCCCATPFQEGQTSENNQTNRTGKTLCSALVKPELAGAVAAQSVSRNHPDTARANDQGFYPPSRQGDDCCQ